MRSRQLSPILEWERQESALSPVLDWERQELALSPTVEWGHPELALARQAQVSKPGIVAALSTAPGAADFLSRLRLGWTARGQAWPGCKLTSVAGKGVSH